MSTAVGLISSRKSSTCFAPAGDKCRTPKTCMPAIHWLISLHALYKPATPLRVFIMLSRYSFHTSRSLSSSFTIAPEVQRQVLVRQLTAQSSPAPCCSSGAISLQPSRSLRPGTSPFPFIQRHAARSRKIVTTLSSASSAGATQIIRGGNLRHPFLYDFDFGIQIAGRKNDNIETALKRSGHLIDAAVSCICSGDNRILSARSFLYRAQAPISSFPTKWRSVHPVPRRRGKSLRSGLSLPLPSPA